MLKGSSLTKNLTKILVIVMVFAVLATGASAQTGSRPALVSVDNVTVTVGQEFTVPVRIAGVSNLYGYDVRLPHDTTILQGVRVDHGNFLNPPWWVVRQGFWKMAGWRKSARLTG